MEKSERFMYEHIYSEDAEGQTTNWSFNINNTLAQGSLQLFRIRI